MFECLMYTYVKKTSPYWFVPQKTLKYSDQLYYVKLPILKYIISDILTFLILEM